MMLNLKVRSTFQSNNVQKKFPKQYSIIAVRGYLPYQSNPFCALTPALKACFTG